jgi:hypothetical protein
MVVTESGMIIFVISDPKNAPTPIVVILFGVSNETTLIFEHPINA